MLYSHIMKSLELLRKTVEARPEEYLSIIAEIPRDQVALRLYARGLQHYLLGEIDCLNQVIDQLKKLPETQEYSSFISLLTVRKLIRTRNISMSDLEPVQKNLSKETNPILIAELYFVHAMGLENLEVHDLSGENYLLAAHQFEKSNTYKKAAKSELNAIVSDSHIFPDRKRHIANYLRVFRKCSRVKEVGMAGVALINVAAEYFRLGAPNVALKFAKRALVFLEADFGTRHYFLALLQTAEILFSLGRKQEADLYMEEVATASFPEVMEAHKVLSIKVYHLPTQHIDTKNLVPTWKEKVSGECAPALNPLGATEQKLLKFLSVAPRTRHELVDLLYGEKGNYESFCNRLHVLINRIRKKIPGVILYENSTYFLVDDAPISMIQG